MLQESQPELKALKQFITSLVPMPETDWQLAVPLLSIKHFKKNDFFVRIGEQKREAGFIVQGLIRKYYLDADGAEFTTALLTENRLVAPYESLLSGKPSESHLQAIEKTVLVVFDYDHFQDLAKNNMRWKEMSLKIAEILLLEREKRQVRQMMDSALERYEDFLRENASLANRVPNYHIASYLGITPEALSRILRTRTGR